MKIPDQVEGVDGTAYPVSEIGKGALEDNMVIESVTIGKNIKKVCAKAFKGATNLKMIIIDDLTVKANSAKEYRVLAKSKGFIKLGKNSLKGTSKELVISVSSKAEKKALKKQLKKAGNKYAKVTVR